MLSLDITRVNERIRDARESGEFERVQFWQDVLYYWWSDLDVQSTLQAIWSRARNLCAELAEHGRCPHCERPLTTHAFGVHMLGYLLCEACYDGPESHFFAAKRDWSMVAHVSTKWLFEEFGERIAPARSARHRPSKLGVVDSRASVWDLLDGGEGD